MGRTNPIVLFIQRTLNLKPLTRRAPLGDEEQETEGEDGRKKSLVVSSVLGQVS